MPHGEVRGELRRPLPGLASGDCGWSPEVLRGGGGVGQGLPRCQEGARRPPGWGPRLACGWLGGKGLQMCRQMGSSRREQVAAFRTLGEPSPPSVTPCPLLSTPPVPRRSGALWNLLWAEWGEAREQGRSEGSEPAEQESRPSRGRLGPEAHGSGSAVQPPQRLGLWQGLRAAGGLPHPRFCLQCGPPALQSD